MSIFCTVTTMFSAVYLYSQKSSFNKVALSIIACITPFMACGTAMGTLFFCGVTFSPIMCITPFLVLAISVDDSFLMLHAWNRLESWRTAPLDKPMKEHMMGEVLVETGPAITISALTNILAFTIGAITSPPEIRQFCYSNAAAIFMDMFYQATFYHRLHDPS
uniref:SSD domain-containing protein n=1 Tax=Caenorhabditis japonica TaxID=281687 RepID=A0A8R1IHP5_CAEJA